MIRIRPSLLLVPAVGIVGAGITMVLFASSNWDLLLQNQLFIAESQTWFWDRHEPITKFLLYDGFKKGLYLLVVVLLVMLIAEGRRTGQWLRHNRNAAALLVMALTPLSVSAMKQITNVPCPRNVVNYGGVMPHVDVLHAWPEGQRPEKLQHCFPAGHASGAFGLLGLLMLFDKRRVKVAIASAVLVVGWMTGGYKMAIGDHFFSHTAVSMWIAVFWYGCVDLYRHIE